MLTFPDDIQVGVVGLDEIMAELHSEGRKPTDEVAEEIKIGRASCRERV